ncbi:MAG: hypothetical protein KC910_25445, partial [Candidatus Eremiobacteraeota bacterium]|nr:hypothetical protein [Candidatus Eremiobacteraeota bacterium]
SLEDPARVQHYLTRKDDPVVAAITSLREAGQLERGLANYLYVFRGMPDEAYSYDPASRGESLLLKDFLEGSGEARPFTYPDRARTLARRQQAGLAVIPAWNPHRIDDFSYRNHPAGPSMQWLEASYWSDRFELPCARPGQPVLWLDRERLGELPDMTAYYDEFSAAYSQFLGDLPAEPARELAVSRGLVPHKPPAAQIEVFARIYRRRCQLQSPKAAEEASALTRQIALASHNQRDFGRRLQLVIPHLDDLPRASQLLKSLPAQAVPDQGFERLYQLCGSLELANQAHSLSRIPDPRGSCLEQLLESLPPDQRHLAPGLYGEWLGRPRVGGEQMISLVKASALAGQLGLASLYLEQLADHPNPAEAVEAFVKRAAQRVSSGQLTPLLGPAAPTLEHDEELLWVGNTSILTR